MENDRNERKDRKTANGATVRNMDMNRSARRTELVESDDDASCEQLQRERRKAYGEAHIVMSDAVGGLERGKINRMEQMDKSGQQDSQRLKME